MPSGKIHKSGSDAMSVARAVVTPSMRLEGTNASNSQRRRCCHVIELSGKAGCSFCGPGCLEGDVRIAVAVLTGTGIIVGDFHSSQAHPAIRNASATKPADQTQLCVASRKFGSRAIG